MEELYTLLEKELNLEGVDEETKNKVLTDLGGVIIERCLALLLAKDESGAIEKLVGEGQLGEAFDYANNNFPYLGEILEATASEVILEYKSAA